MLQILALLLFSALEVSAVTKRSANAVIINKSGREMVKAGLWHKYSDNYKESREYAQIKNSEKSPSLKVEYHTGAFTTGRDWWKVLNALTRGSLD